MQLHAEQLSQLAAQAITAAQQAGKVISGLRGKEIAVCDKSSGDSRASQVVTEVDLLSQQAILDILRPSCHTYELALLTEEQADTPARLEKDYFWCIDPLDGTLPFIEGSSGFAVSIALVSKAGIPQLGVVLDPFTHTLYHAVKGQGLFRNNLPWRPKVHDSRFTIIVDRSFLEHARFPEIEPALRHLAGQMGYAEIELSSHGGAVMNACWVLERAPALYCKLPKPQNGGGSLWDYAATAALFQGAQAFAGDIYGEPLDLNRPDSTFMNHRGILYAHNTALAHAASELLLRFVEITKR